MKSVGAPFSDSLRQDLRKVIEKLASCPGARSVSVQGKIWVALDQLNRSPFTVLWLEALQGEAIK